MSFWNETLKLHSPLPRPKVAHRQLVIYDRRDTLFGYLSKAQGFFAEFHAVLGALKFAESHGATGVTVQFGGKYYLDPAHGQNWWSYFFEEEMPIQGSVAKGKPVHCRGWHRYGPYAWNDSWTVISNPSNSAKLPYPLGDMSSLTECRRLTQKYIRLKPAIASAIDAEWKKISHGADFVVGVHFRGTDKYRLYPDQSPDVALYVREIKAAIARAAAKVPRIFVATDQQDFADEFLQHFPGRVVMLPQVPRYPNAGRPTGVHKDPQFSPYEKGRSVVFDAVLLARCDYLVKNRSSVSDASLAFNPDLQCAMILGRDIHHVG